MLCTTVQSDCFVAINEPIRIIIYVFPVQEKYDLHLVFSDRVNRPLFIYLPTQIQNEEFQAKHSAIN